MQKLYAVFDMVANVVVGDALMLFPSDGAAARMFIDVLRSPKTPMYQHPNDYCLLCFGQLEEDSTGDLFISPIRMAQRSPIMLGKDVGSDPAQLSLLSQE